MEDHLIMLEMDMTNPVDQKLLKNVWRFCDESKCTQEYKCQYDPKNARFVYVLFDTFTNEVLGRMAFNISIKDDSIIDNVLLINIATANQAKEKTIIKRKLGTIMIKYLIDKSKEMMAKKISLIADFRSKAFYDKLGFVKEGYFYVYKLK